MEQPLYYCMSNTQLRKIIYACGKSQQAKNKAAAVLRLRKTLTAKQQVSLSGYSYNFIQEKCILIPHTAIQKITRKTKGYLKQKTQQITRSLNFSSLIIESAGSLSLQGRTPLLPYKSIELNKNGYQRGVRRNKRIVTRPRQRLEVPEDVPRTVAAVQPAKQESVLVQQSQHYIHNNKLDEEQPLPSDTLVTKNCKGGQSCGLNLERAVDPKPASAYFKIIARYIIYGVAGLICLPLIIIGLLFILRVILILLPKIIAITILISPLVIIVYLFKWLIQWYRRKDDLEHIRQQMMNNWQPRLTIDRFGNRVRF